MFCRLRLPTVDRDRLHDSRMLNESRVHPLLPEVRYLLTTGQRFHGPVFLQCNGVLRGADLAAVSEGEKKNKNVCGHTLTFM